MSDVNWMSIFLFLPGFFSLSVRVVPRDDHGSWLIREPTTKVHNNFSPLLILIFNSEYDLDLSVIPGVHPQQPEAGEGAAQR